MCANFKEKPWQLILSNSIVFIVFLSHLLAHFIHIDSFHAIFKSDLMSEKKGVTPPSGNMHNHMLSLSENIYFEPFKLAGLLSYLLDISRIM